MADLDPTRLALAIEQLYEAAAAPELWSAALDSLARASGGTHALTLYAPPHGGWYECSPGMKDCVEAFFREGWMSSNVRAPKGLKAIRDGQVVFSEETIFSPGELDRTPVQNEFFDRYDLRCFFGFDFVPGQILANIERGRDPIADWELDAMRRVMPHFRRIGQLAAARGIAAVDAAVDALDAMLVGAIIVDHNGRVLRMNAKAEAISSSVLTIRDGIMSARHAAAAPDFDRLVRQAVARLDPFNLDFGGIVGLPRPDKRPILVKAVPLKGAARDIFQRAKAIVILNDPDDRSGVDARNLGRVFGMTATEARIATYIANGDALANISEAMGVSIATVRTHLKAIFIKTGTHRQAELSALLSRVL